jgi:hypothetical protein
MARCRPTGRVRSDRTRGVTPRQTYRGRSD